jgi:hypothetical protein
MDVQLTQADLNKRLVEAVVKLRLRDCKRRLLVKADEMAEYEKAIMGALLSSFFADTTTDPLADLSLALIEGEVELTITESSAVIALACLNAVGIFEPEMYIAVNYVDPVAGRNCYFQHHIRSLGKSFPFTVVFQPLGHGPFMISDAGRGVLSIYAKSRGAPEAQYAIAPATAQRQPPNVPTHQTLPAGWGLSDARV